MSTHERICDFGKLKNYVSFSDIMALQIIDNKIRSKNGVYYVYELNILKRDGSRGQVIGHGNYSILRKDSLELA
ncbi:MAG: hypothetical protein ACRC37_06720, partial [Lentisphaeria bacterium]